MLLSTKPHPFHPAPRGQKIRAVWISTLSKNTKLYWTVPKSLAGNSRLQRLPYKCQRCFKPTEETTCLYV